MESMSPPTWSKHPVQMGTKHIVAAPPPAADWLACIVAKPTTSHSPPRTATATAKMLFHSYSQVRIFSVLCHYFSNSMPMDINTSYSSSSSVPCVPTNVQASLVCLSNSAAATWQSVSGALFYQAKGITVDGAHTAYCNSSLQQCNLKHLLCGQVYNVSVLSIDHTCSSEESLFTQVHTGKWHTQTVKLHTSV